MAYLSITSRNLDFSKPSYFSKLRCHYRVEKTICGRLRGINTEKFSEGIERCS